MLIWAAGVVGRSGRIRLITVWYMTSQHQFGILHVWVIFIFLHVVLLSDLLCGFFRMSPYTFCFAGFCECQEKKGGIALPIPLSLGQINFTSTRPNLNPLDLSGYKYELLARAFDSISRSSFFSDCAPPSNPPSSFAFSQTRGILIPIFFVF
ncbi:hypothetical protein ACFX1W_024145 [Malus domestica]